MMRHLRTVSIIAGLLLASITVFLLRESSDSSSQWLSSPNTAASSDDSPPSLSHADEPANHRPAPKFAFATFLSGGAAIPSHLPANATASQDELDDGYFAGARHLTYSLLHHPSTKSTSPIPFLVLVTPSVSATKRARLEADGATIVVADPIPLPDWIKPGAERWRDVATKLRLFMQTGFEKICFLDADQLVVAPLDGVFADPATDVATTLASAEQVRPDEPPLPKEYMFAGRPDTFGTEHALPPPEKEDDYLNAGFYVFRPSREVFDYYVGLMQIEGRFDGGFPEQDMFNYAHRHKGNMPWKALDWRWAINWPTSKDLEAGVRTFHGKYWDTTRKYDATITSMWLDRWEVLKAFYGET